MFGKKSNTTGQVTVEYAVMFMFIVAAVIVAGLTIMQPSVNRVFQASEKVINVAIEKVENSFSGN